MSIFESPAPSTVVAHFKIVSIVSYLHLITSRILSVIQHNSGLLDQSLRFLRGSATPDYSSLSSLLGKYRIAGKFGGELNLAI